MQRRRTAGTYFSVNSWRVNVHLIVNLVHTIQYVLIEYVVHSTLVYNFEHNLCLFLKREEKWSKEAT